MELNQRERTIKIKIVYYGPPLGGKTTNIAKLHEAAHASRRGDMTSVNSAQDRTILFDLLPLTTSGFRGFDLKIQLVAVPGQPMYALTRRVVLKAVDGLVFVANSAVDRWEDNIQSYKEMLRNLVMADYQVDSRTIPFVLQYNKRDLPNVMPVESLDRALNQRKVQPILAVASRGEGVLETFAAILTDTVQDLLLRYRGMEMAPGLSVNDWVAETMDSLFDKGVLTAGETPGPPPAHRKVRIGMPEDGPAASTFAPPRKMEEALVESYAEASVQLGEMTGWLRDERDLARSRLGHVTSALDVADEIGKGTSVVAGLVRALGVLAEAGGSVHASFLLPAPVGSFRAVLRPPLAEDPLLKTFAGPRILETLREVHEPSCGPAIPPTWRRSLPLSSQGSPRWPRSRYGGRSRPAGRTSCWGSPSSTTFPTGRCPRRIPWPICGSSLVSSVPRWSWPRPAARSDAGRLSSGRPVLASPARAAPP